MIKQNLVVYSIPILYKILKEIEPELNFNIFFLDNKQDGNYSSGHNLNNLISNKIFEIVDLIPMDLMENYLKYTRHMASNS